MKRPLPIAQMCRGSLILILFSRISTCASFQIHQRNLFYDSDNTSSCLLRLRTSHHYQSQRLSLRKSLIEDNEEESYHNELTIGRRRSIIQAASGLLSLSALVVQNPSPSHAGLVQFPCTDGLMNTYHFMRSGQSLLESQNILSTNPLFLTNRDDALSTLGIEQVQEACKDMLARDINPSVVKYSLAAKAMDTANIIATEMNIGRNRLIPEYTFMDQRGVGRWDMQPLDKTEKAVWALDYSRAGEEGRGGRPPPHDNGTPNETLSEQVIRLRQLISVLETQFSGDTILLVFPDGTSPALLSALIAGIPLNRTHELNYTSGQVRYNITMKNVRDEVLSNKNDNDDDVPSSLYTTTINEGLGILNSYESNPNQFVEAEDEELLMLERAEQMAAKARRDEKKTTTTTNIKSRMPLVERRGEISTMHQDDTRDISLTGIVSLVVGYFTFSAVSSSSSKDERLFKEQEEGLTRNDVEPHDDDDDDDHVQLPTSTTSPELERMEELIVSAPFEIPEMKETKVPTKEERIELANTAMDEYLDMDDGEAGWLEFMVDLTSEEETDLSMEGEQE